MLIEDDDFAPVAPVKAKPRTKAVESETSTTLTCISWLKAQPRTFARKVHTGPMGEGGHPDIDACQAGRAIKIEMKVPGKKPDSRQMARLRIWQDSGALVGWATSLPEVKAIMAHCADPAWINPLTGPGAPEADRRYG